MEDAAAYSLRIREEALALAREGRNEEALDLLHRALSDGVVNTPKNRFDFGKVVALTASDDRAFDHILAGLADKGNIEAAAAVDVAVLYGYTDEKPPPGWFVKAMFSADDAEHYGVRRDYLKTFERVHKLFMDFNGMRCACCAASTSEVELVRVRFPNHRGALECILQAQPGDRDAACNLAAFHIRRGDPTSALEVLRNARAAAGIAAHPLLHLDLADLLVNHFGEFEEAFDLYFSTLAVSGRAIRVAARLPLFITICERAANTDEKRRFVEAGMLRFYSIPLSYAEEIGVFMRGMYNRPPPTTDPMKAIAFRDRAVELLRKRKMSEAVEEVLRGFMTNLSDTYTCSATFSLILGATNDITAHAFIERSLFMDPTEPVARAYFTIVERRKLGDPPSLTDMRAMMDAEAPENPFKVEMEALVNELAAERTNQQRRAQGLTRLLSPDETAALNNLREEIDSHPKAPKPRRQLAAFLRKIDALDLALRFLDEALLECDEDILLRLDHAELEAEVKGEVRKARRTFEDISDRHPRDKTVSKRLKEFQTKFAEQVKQLEAEDAALKASIDAEAATWANKSASSAPANPTTTTAPSATPQRAVGRKARK